MIISFSPRRCDDNLILEKIDEDIISINGDIFDFGLIPEGGYIPESVIPTSWISGPVKRINGEICLKVTLPHGPSPETFQSFPDSISVTEDGIIDIPRNTIVNVFYEKLEDGFNLITETDKWKSEIKIDKIFISYPKEEPEIEDEE